MEPTGPITPRERDVLDAASNHSYLCRCDLCLAWWALMGPNGGEPGKYGPFSRAEVNERQRQLGESETG